MKPYSALTEPRNDFKQNLNHLERLVNLRLKWTLSEKPVMGINKLILAKIARINFPLPWASLTEWLETYEVLANMKQPMKINPTQPNEKDILESLIEAHYQSIDGLRPDLFPERLSAIEKLSAVANILPDGEIYAILEEWILRMAELAEMEDKVEMINDVGLEEGTRIAGIEEMTGSGMLRELTADSRFNTNNLEDESAGKLDLKEYSDFPLHAFLEEHALSDVSGWQKIMLSIIKRQKSWLDRAQRSHAPSPVVIQDVLEECMVLVEAVQTRTHDVRGDSVVDLSDQKETITRLRSENAAMTTQIAELVATNEVLTTNLEKANDPIRRLRDAFHERTESLHSRAPTNTPEVQESSPPGDYFMRDGSADARQWVNFYAVPTTNHHLQNASVDAGELQSPGSTPPMHRSNFPHGQDSIAQYEKATVAMTSEKVHQAQENFQYQREYSAALRDEMAAMAVQIDGQTLVKEGEEKTLEISEMKKELEAVELAKELAVAKIELSKTEEELESLRTSGSRTESLFDFEAQAPMQARSGDEVYRTYRSPSPLGMVVGGKDKMVEAKQSRSRSRARLLPEDEAYMCGSRPPKGKAYMYGSSSPPPSSIPYKEIERTKVQRSVSRGFSAPARGRVQVMHPGRSWW